MDTMSAYWIRLVQAVQKPRPARRRIGPDGPVHAKHLRMARLRRQELQRMADLPELAPMPTVTINGHPIPPYVPPTLDDLTTVYGRPATKGRGLDRVPPGLENIPDLGRVYIQK